MESEGPAPVHLSRSRERTEEVDALVAAAGGRVGLAGVLDDLDRRARRVRRLGAAYAFAWDRADQRDPQWWPQGITSSADAADGADEHAGRRVLLTSSYAKPVGGASLGARVSVVDLAEPDRPRYRHVLLVNATVGDTGALELQPVRAHAGGIVWRGDHLHVAGTAKGIHTFRLADVVAARPGLFDGSGHDYLLPARFVHRARVEGGTERFRYSFLSLARSPRGAELLAGEYGRAGMTTRFARYALDPAGLPVADDSDVVRPARLDECGVSRMQGAVEADGRLHVTTSAGRFGRGSLWTGRPGELRRHRWALPAGPEDLCHWPSEDRLWTVTEYPRRRVVLALDRRRFD